MKMRCKCNRKNYKHYEIECNGENDILQAESQIDKMINKFSSENVHVVELQENGQTVGFIVEIY